MKKVVTILFKCLCIASMFVSMWIVLTPYFRTEKNIEGDQFRNMPNNTIDVLALGSSHMQYAFNPGSFYLATGYYSYVLGSACQPMSMSYSFLKEALKTQSPEVVIVDVFTMLPHRDICYTDGIYYLAIQQMTGLNQIQAATYVKNEEVRYQYMFDLIMNHSNWKDIDFSNTAMTTDSFHAGLGYVRDEPKDFNFRHLILFETLNEIELSKDEKQIIDAMISLCEKEGIKLIFMKTPYIIDQENQDKLQAIWDYVDSKGIEYIDLLNGAEEIEWTFGMNGDTWHNNSWGAEKVTTFLANYVQEKAYIKNHQTNDIYEGLLEKIIVRNAQSLMGSDQINIYTLLGFAAEYPNTMIVKYTAMNTSLGEYENQILQNAGVNHDFSNDTSTNYYAIIENRVVIKESNEPFEAIYNGKTIVINDDEIIINGETFEVGELSIIFTNEEMTWFNSIPIDYASRYFWKNGCDNWACE